MSPSAEFTPLIEKHKELEGIDKIIVDNAWENLCFGISTAEESEFMIALLVEQGEETLSYLYPKIIEGESVPNAVYELRTKVFAQIAERLATEKSVPLLVGAMEDIYKNNIYDAYFDTPNVILKTINSALLGSGSTNSAACGRLTALYIKEKDQDSIPSNWIFDLQSFWVAISLSGGYASKSFLEGEAEELKKYSGNVVSSWFVDSRNIPSEYTDKVPFPKHINTEPQNEAMQFIEDALESGKRVEALFQEQGLILCPAELAIAKIIYLRHQRQGILNESDYVNEVTILHNLEREAEGNKFILPKGLELEIRDTTSDVFEVKSVLQALGLKSSRESRDLFEIKHDPTFSSVWQSRLLQELTAIGFVPAEKITGLMTRAELVPDHDLSLHVNFEIPVEVDKHVSKITGIEESSLEYYYDKQQVTEFESRMNVLIYILTMAYSTEERVMGRKTKTSWRTRSDKSVIETSRGGKTKLEIRVPVFLHPQSFSMLRELDILVTAMFADFRISNGETAEDLQELASIWHYIENSVRFGQPNWVTNNSKPNETDLMRVFQKYDDGDKNDIAGNLIDLRHDANKREIVNILKNTRVKKEARDLMKQSYLKGKKLFRLS